MSVDDGFFSRWSRRKARVRGGEMPPDEAPKGAPSPAADRVAAAAPENAPHLVAPPSAVRPAPAATPAEAAPADAAPRALAPPTLADVAQLTPGSNFARFVAPGVDRSVQHAALRTLFSDPHFNVMDGLDTYIGDYNAPDPIPAAMLHRLKQVEAMQRAGAPPSGAGPAPVGSEATRAPAVCPDGAPAPILPPSDSASEIAAPEPDADEDTDLRLQPDDAADAAGAGPDRPGPRA